MKSVKKNERKKNSTPITVNIPNNLLKDFDKRAENDGITRTALLITAMRSYLDMGTAFQYMPQLLKILENSNNSSNP